MQSSGSENPLLRDRAPAYRDQLADGSGDEPRRVVVAVAASRPVDEDHVLTADLLAPAPQARLPRKRTEPCAPFPLDCLRNRVSRRCDGAGPRRVGENVDCADPGLLDDVAGAPERTLVFAGKAHDHVSGQVEAS